MNLQSLLQTLVRPALASLVADPEPFVTQIKPTQDPKHGDYQLNAALALQKTLGKKPREIAQLLADRIELRDVLEKPEIAGPGFINLRFRNDWLAAQLPALARDERLGVAKADPVRTYVVDFSSPNVAKPMHVGHLRSTIIGDSIARLLRFLGHSVITDNHLGDWGTQFGILLYGYKHHLDREAFQADPVRELARLYKFVRKQMAGDEEEAVDPIAEACRQETAKLHAGDPENLALWQQFMPHCLEEIEQMYRRLDVHFDHTYGESFYHPMLPKVVEELKAKGIAVESRGAQVVFFGKDEPPAIVQKRDGAYTYTTSDLATIQYRTEHWRPDAILYVVDFRQSLHFQNLFDIARRWGCSQAELVHISFGSVLGKDGKPLKTREGENVELSRLLDDAVAQAAAIGAANMEGDPSEAAAQERAAIAEAVGLGAVKYADLCQNRTSDYEFSFDKMMAMTGNTGTYMQYAYARNRSIFRIGNEDVSRFHTQPPLALVESPHERALALHLLRLEEKLTAAAAEFQPSGVTSYLWELAKTYSGFFQNCPVLKAESAQLRDSRLLLCDLTARTLQLGLNLLGIRTVERM